MNFLPTLIIDAHGAAAKQPAQQLTHSGFTADSVVTCTDALAAVLVRHYRSMIFLGDLRDPEDAQCVVELHKRAPRTWIIMISSTELHARAIPALRGRCTGRHPLFRGGPGIQVNGVLAVLTPTVTAYAMQPVGAEQSHDHFRARSEPRSSADHGEHRMGLRALWRLAQ